MGPRICISKSSPRRLLAQDHALRSISLEIPERTRVSLTLFGTSWHYHKRQTDLVQTVQPLHNFLGGSQGSGSLSPFHTMTSGVCRHWERTRTLLTVTRRSCFPAGQLAQVQLLAHTALKVEEQRPKNSLKTTPKPHHKVDTTPYQLQAWVYQWPWPLKPGEVSKETAHFLPSAFSKHFYSLQRHIPSILQTQELLPPSWRFC